MKLFLFTTLLLVMFYAVYSPDLKKLKKMSGDILDAVKKPGTVRKKTGKIRKSLYDDMTAATSNKSDMNEMPVEIFKNSDTDDLSRQATIKLIRNPIIDDLLEMDEISLPSLDMPDIGSLAQGVFNELTKQDKQIKIIFFVSAGGLFLLMLITKRTAFSGYALLFSNFGFNLSRAVIALTALTAMVSWVIYQFNFYTHISGISFTGPLTLLVASSISLKIYDFNNPVWNRLIYSLSYMTFSALIIRFIPITN